MKLAVAANAAQVSIEIRGLCWASAISAMLAVDSTANAVAAARVGQRRIHNSAPTAAPTDAASVQASGTTPRGPVGVQIVPSASTDSPAAISAMVNLATVAIPHACR